MKLLSQSTQRIKKRCILNIIEKIGKKNIVVRSMTSEANKKLKEKWVSLTTKWMYEK